MCRNTGLLIEPIFEMGNILDKGICVLKKFIFAFKLRTPPWRELVNVADKLIYFLNYVINVFSKHMSRM
ncbi:hypothetical protein Trydic_g22703 [Trypoxylus dichotomus]